MEVGLAGVAEYATFEGGVLNCLGFRRMLALPLPSRVELSFVLMLFPSPEEYNTVKKIGMQLLMPDGDVKIKFDDIEVKFLPPDEEFGVSSTNLSSRVIGLNLEREGRYTVRYYEGSEDTTICSYEFGVVHRGAQQ